MSYLPWHGTFVYHYLRGPLTLTPVAKHLAVELSLSLLNDLCLWRPGFDPWYPAYEADALATEPPQRSNAENWRDMFNTWETSHKMFKRNMYVFLIDFHSPAFNIRDIMNFRFYGLIACYPILKCVNSLKFYTFYQLYSSSNFPLISFWKHFSCGCNSIISSFQHTYTCILLYRQFSD